jgi:hypothetical protein
MTFHLRKGTYGRMIVMLSFGAPVIFLLAIFAVLADCVLAQAATTAPRLPPGAAARTPNAQACAVRYQTCVNVCAQRASQCAAHGGTATLCEGSYRSCATSCRALAIACR